MIPRQKIIPNLFISKFNNMLYITCNHKYIDKYIKEFIHLHNEITVVSESSTTLHYKHNHNILNKTLSHKNILKYIQKTQKKFELCLFWNYDCISQSVLSNIEKHTLKLIVIVATNNPKQPMEEIRTYLNKHKYLSTSSGNPTEFIIGWKYLDES